MGELKAKKPFYKKWWVWLIAAIILIGIVTPQAEDKAKEDETVPVTAEKKEETPKETVKKEKPKKVKNAAEMSAAEFGQLTTGMTYEEAVAIIGSEGEVMSESGDKGTDLYTVMYTWDGEGDIGANANLLFQGGKLNTKAQFGLK